MRKRGLLQNAMILTVTSFILRSLGMLLRSYMAGVMKEEGMGLYQLIISIYVLAVTIVTTGVSTAVIRIITESQAISHDDGKTKKIMKKSILLSLVLSCVTILLFSILVNPISIWWVKDARLVTPIRMLIMVLPFVSVSACLKSYFIAKRKITTNAFSQLLEQILRMGLIFYLLECFYSDNIEKMCTYIIFSDVISEIISCLYLYFKYHREQKMVKNSLEKTFSIRTFSEIAFPITVNKCLSSFLRTTENVLIPNQLTQYTLSRGEALAEFGALKAMALPLLFFPASFLSAISTLMLPETSEAKKLHQESRIQKLVTRTFQVTLICGILISAIFFIYSKEMGSIFYSQNHVDVYLHKLALLIPFMYLESAIMGMMQGLNQQRRVLLYNTIDSFIRITFIFFLLPKYGMQGFVWIMYFSNITTSSLNAWRILKITHTKFDLANWVIKPLVALFCAICFDYVFCHELTISNVVLRLLFHIFVQSSIYVIVLGLQEVLRMKSIRKMKV